MVLHLKPVLLACWMAMVCSPAVTASPVTWQLLPAGFYGGGSLSGSFVYDADSNALSSVAVVSGADGDFGGSLYTISDPSYGPYPYELALLSGPMADATGAPVLDLYFFLPLTNAGGTLLFAASEYACADAGCSYPAVTWRYGEGYATAETAMAAPGSGTVLGAGFVLAGLVARQKSHHRRMRVPIRKEGPGV